jgi:HlyD family secretion protein
MNLQDRRSTMLPLNRKSPMQRRSMGVGAGVLLAIALWATLAVRAADEKPTNATTAGKPAGATTAGKPPNATTAAKPSLTVAVVQPVQASVPLTVAANGSIAAWQEASVGAEANGWRLAEVRVNVGDRVRRGDVLATFSPEIAEADLAQARATVAEADATLAEAAANAQRARDLQPSGALSAQQITQFMTAERTAQARLEAQRAAVRVAQLRLAQTRVLAPDEGVISSRSATVGAVVPAGQELFRLIRKGRLEWRAELAASDLAAVRPGQTVRLTPAGGSPIEGTVRMLAPTVDAATRNGLVYVDLPSPGAARAGMFASGEFELGSVQALTLPQSAVLLRDGFSQVFVVGADGRVNQRKVTVGRRVGERIAVSSGLDASARVVASGAGFLADGDSVRVVDPPPAAPAAIKP